MPSSAVAFARQNQPRFLEELKALLRIPSVSTDPAHAADTRRAAEFVAAELRRIGMENVCGDMDASLARARQIIELKKNKKTIDSGGIVP